MNEWLMIERVQELINLYKIRTTLQEKLAAVHGDEKAAGIVFELANVIRDLESLIKEAQ